MAVVRTFNRTNANSSLYPTEVDAEWTIIASDTSKLLQISTFGSDDRASRRKVSQAIQFDREMAQLLKAAIESTFPGI
ncbi:MAG: hypothetical protein BGO26_20730 [Actinobacteria bacterium 69-20]|nr:hypothetical protein [Actinomycetota bacterium]OJV24910.1 MAG: hypothetical protein BGO26_20730 [Actinobacteria bacterium 69-20]